MHVILKLHSLGINQGMTSSPANPLFDLNMHWQKSHYHIERGFLYCLWWVKRRGKSLDLPNSQLAAQLESFGDFYTKKLSLIIKLSDCSFIDLFRICISMFSFLCLLLLWDFFTLHSGSISLHIWRGIIVHRLAFRFFFCPWDRWNIDR